MEDQQPIEKIKKTRKSKKDEALPITPSEEVISVNDDFIKKELTKFNIVDATIAQWNEQYGSLKISSPDNKEEYEAVNTARIFVKKKRIEIEKIGKGLRTNAVKFQKSVLEEERRIITLLDPLETYLEEETDRIDNIKEAVKLEKETKEQALLQERAVKLIELGMNFTGEAYILEELRISVMSLKTSDNFTWNSLLVAVETRAKQIAEIKAAEIRKAEEQTAIAKQLAEDNLRKEAELFAKEKELTDRMVAIEAAELLAKQQAENRIREAAEVEKRKAEDLALVKLKATADMLKMRKSELFSLGFSQNNRGLTFQEIVVLEEEISEKSLDEWQKYLNAVNSEVNRIKAELETKRLNEIELAKQAAVEAERKRQEEESFRIKSEEEKERVRIEAETLAKKIEEKCLTDLQPDIQKFNMLCKTITTIEIPNFSTPEYQKFTEVIKSDILNIVKTLYAKKPS